MDLFGLDDLPAEIKVVWNLKVEDAQAFVSGIKDEKDVKGCVIRLRSRQRVKIKAEWYSRRHKLGKGSPSDMDLVETVLNDAIDDLRSTYTDAPEMLDKMDQITKDVSDVYNDIAGTVTGFFERNQELSKREHAMLVQEEPSCFHMNLVMKMYRTGSVHFAPIVLQRLKTIGVGREA